MRLLHLILLSLFASSCKERQTVIIPSNYENSILGTRVRPVIFWGMISGKTDETRIKRWVTIYLYGSEKVLYRFMSQECLGGASYRGDSKLVGNKLVLSIPSEAFISDYHRDIFVGNFTVKNDSTLISSEKHEFIRLECSKENVEFFEAFLKESY